MSMENQEKSVVISGNVSGYVTIGNNSPITVNKSGELELENRMLREERDWLRSMLERAWAKDPKDGPQRAK